MNYNVFIENEYQDWDVDIESVKHLYKRFLTTI